MALEIDDSLYSRQRYVLGDKAMLRMVNCNVLVVGLGGLGVEIAKNVVLAGIKTLAVYDPQPASLLDLASQFFLTEEDVKLGRGRAEASLPKLRELNPYVSVDLCTHPISCDSDIGFLEGFQCVIMTDASLSLQVRIDEFCRSHQPPIAFISCGVRGVSSFVFCDFGPCFTVVDHNGEDGVEAFVGNISVSTPGIVTCLENHLHGLETGDVVCFKEVVGMEDINGTHHTVKVLSSSQFSIGDTSGFREYKHGGRACQVKVPKQVQFASLADQLKNPSYATVDFSKLDAPVQIHMAFLALDSFVAQCNRLPRPRDEEDAAMLVKLATVVNESCHLVQKLDVDFLQSFSFVAQGCLSPLTSVVGGIVAQEGIIALTGKFSPLQQWLLLDASEVLKGQGGSSVQSFQQRGDRYDSLRICLGDSVLSKLADLKLFMVGCGAIGCEMLKNYALMGVGRRPSGQLTITDNDLIEKSNLNRQFLFRNHHIQQPKSVVAAKSVSEINPDLHINALEQKVFPGTEQKIFNDTFFQAQDIVVNALDNVEARRYMDGRCVSNQRPLLESGTLGAKGHVQVIIPHLTESYTSQADPPERDVPYCTLKSFPASIEHTIQWARDKFENLFAQKPTLYLKFWETYKSPENVLEEMKRHSTPDGVVRVVKLLKNRPVDFAGCVTVARVKFEKYFNRKAQDLLSAFPLDTKMKDGSLFWQSPKRPPTPLLFDAQNPMHLSFVTSFARLYADIWNVHYSERDLTAEVIRALVAAVQVPAFKSTTKRIETDEKVKKPESREVSHDDLEVCLSDLEGIIRSQVHIRQPEVLKMSSVSFEKDNDINGHIDFVTSTSNLRAAMYSIESADRFKTKLIAGRIVPAIATTTATIAGLVSIELIKLVIQLPLECFKNAFLNLAIPSLVFSEPAAAAKTTIDGKLSFTLWDRWEVKGNPSFQLQDFLTQVKTTYGCEPSMVVYGVRMIYVPMMPGHKKRLPQSMVSLLKPGQEKSYVDLTVAYGTENGDVPGPPIRYFFK
ncbi:hypothetical protein EMCRGX_G021995 [Ephydatia muelleri]